MLLNNFGTFSCTQSCGSHDIVSSINLKFRTKTTSFNAIVTTRNIQINKYLFRWNKYCRSLVNRSWNLNSLFLEREEKVFHQQPLRYSWSQEPKFLLPSRRWAALNNFPWYPKRDSVMKAVKCKAKGPKESSQIHFQHYLVFCLSTLSVFSPTIRETDAGCSRPWFASHTNLSTNLSHWICLLHRSLSQDKPWPETAKKNP